MKQISGFISNSSSSSFIATIAVITDEEKFSKFEEESSFKFERFTYDQICSTYGDGDFYDNFSKPKEEYSNATFVHEWDRSDIDECEFEDGDYDSVGVDDCDFDAKVLALYDAGDVGIEVIEQTFYAGRDG